MSSQSLYSLVPSRGRADRIILDLKAAEFSRTEIGTLFFARHSDAERIPLARSIGTAQGAAPIQGGLAWVAGIGQLVVPGIGSFFAAGPIIAALHQARSGAAWVAISRALTYLDMAAETATRYEHRIKTEGWIMLSVRTVNPNKILRARMIFAESQAQDVYPLAPHGARHSHAAIEHADAVLPVA